ASIRSPVQPVKYVWAYEQRVPARPAPTNAITIQPSVVVRPWLTSSTALPTRIGGASDAAVAARSETIASAVRALYGLASRESVESRRLVADQDQSSTLTPRCWTRCDPGCQTRTSRTPPKNASGQRR